MKGTCPLPGPIADRGVGARRGLALRTVALGLMLLAGGTTASAQSDVHHVAPAPQRIVSLTVCTDQLLLELVPRERIAALSYLATDPTLSSKVEEARGFKSIHASAEEVVQLAPDLVIAQQYSMTPTVDLLRRLGYRVVLVPLGSDFDGLRNAIRTIAEAVGEKPRGEELIASFDERVAAAAPKGPERPTALAYEVNSLVSGPGTLVDAALAASGFRNAARDMRLGPGGRLPLEEVVADPPDLIVLANAPDEFRSVVGDNLRHPAFTELVKRQASMRLAMPLWLCPTPELAEAVERLGRMRETLISKGASHD